VPRAFLGAALIAAALGFQATRPADGEWLFYGRDAGSVRYSPLTQIRREKASGVGVAWTFHTGDVAEGKNGDPRSGFEATPLLVDADGHSMITEEPQGDALVAFPLPK
jgi:quinoprotein glucose dehydrogenase